MLPLLADGGRCGGFDWSDEAFDRAYAELERSLFGGRRTYAAMTPLVGLALGTQVELADGLRLRVAAAGELAAPGRGRPAAPGVRERARRSACSSSSARCFPTSRAPADAPGSSPTRSGPCGSRPRRRSPPARCCSSGWTGARWRAPVLPIAATEPPGEPTRLDAFRARLASDLLVRLAAPRTTQSSPKRSTAGSCRCSRTSRSARSSCASRSPRCSGARRIVGGRGAGAVLLGETARDRAEQLERLRGLARGETAGAGAADAVRKAVVETLAHGDR